MGTADRATRSFATIWTATWLRQAPYRRRPSGFAAKTVSTLWNACLPAAGPKNSDTDYFARLANVPNLPRDYKVRALAIVMHQRREAALQRLIMADEA